VHHLVCEFIAAQAEAEAEVSGGWTGYRNVFLTAEVQDLIRSRLPHDEPKGHVDAGHADVAGDGPGSAKKRKRDDVPPAPVADDVSWTICCMDGATFSVEVPEHARVAEIKRAIGAAREVPYFAMELFIKDQEKALDDELRMGPLNRPPLFMLVKVSSERLALVALFKSTGGASDWNDKVGWEELEEDEEVDLVGATGVEEIDAEGRVTKLLLNEIGMAGPLPGIEILQLSALQELNLADNRLTGVIPAELGQLGALRTLGLGGNQLSGSIPPELGQLGALTHLYLENNQLSGSIPAELGQLGALAHLSLQNNQLSGRIPAAELGQLGALTQLQLQENQLSGSIPAELGQLGALAHLYLDGNQLSGQEAFQSHLDEHHAGCELLL
jgi:Leucine-rich repeat (LRR) protein